MTDFHAEHEQAVWVSHELMVHVQESLMEAKEKAETAVGAVAQATGGNNCRSEAGRNAFEISATLADFIDELHRKVDVIKGELERYANGF